MVLIKWETLRIIAPYSVILAVVGLLESPMIVALIDELTETRGNNNIECLGQGIAVEVMFMVVFSTFEWISFRILHKIPRADAFVLVLVSGVMVFTDIAIALATGVKENYRDLRLRQRVQKRLRMQNRPLNRPYICNG